MTTKKEKRNLIQYSNLPDSLKDAAMKKAIKIGYTEKEASTLWFNVQNDELANGVIDKGFFQRTGSPFRLK